jgi:hypothetical protein
MPEYEVTLRYTVSWLGRKTVKAKDEEAATAQVEAQFLAVTDLASFTRFVTDEGEPEIDEETLHVEEVNEV